MANKRELSKDVVMFFLVRLPVSSLVRFRCVSRCWRDLVKSPEFISYHFLNESNNKPMLLVRRYLRSPQKKDILSFHNIDSPELEEVRPNLSIPFFKDLDYIYSPEVVYLLGTCDGLVCIACNECIIICNPALREFKQLPPCPLSRHQGYGNNNMGNGFSTTRTNGFKVVLIRRAKMEGYYDVHLFDSSENSWRLIRDDTTKVPTLVQVPCSEALLNGVCHWNAYTYMSCFIDIILSFDLNTDVFNQLEYPDCLKLIDLNEISLMILNNCLCLLRYPMWMNEPGLMEVWVMKEYGYKDSWIKQFVIGPCFITRPVLSWMNGEWMLVESKKGQLISCALETDHIKKFSIYGANKTLRAQLYKESLISLNSLHK